MPPAEIAPFAKAMIFSRPLFILHAVIVISLASHAQSLLFAQSAASDSREAFRKTGSSAGSTDRIFVQERCELREGPGESYRRRINEKATRLLDETVYQAVDPSVRIKILDQRDGWTKVRVVEPVWLAESHVGWIREKVLGGSVPKSDAELKLEHQKKCCGQDPGTIALIDAQRLIADLGRLGLTETVVEWKKSTSEPGWIAIVFKLWPDPLDKLDVREILSVESVPLSPNEVNCQVIGPDEHSVSSCVVEAELRHSSDAKDTMLLALEVMKTIDRSIPRQILVAFAKRNEVDFGRWKIRKQSYENGETSVFADFDCSKPIELSNANDSK